MCVCVGRGVGVEGQGLICANHVYYNLPLNA